MRVLVAVKRVLDYNVKARIASGAAAVDLNNVKMSINPFCEIAVEQAVRLKEASSASEVVAVSIGPKQAQETLRTALAMGADRAVHVETDARIDQELQPLAVAKLLQQVATAQEADLVITGKQAIDGDSAQTGPMLAGLLDWPQAAFAAGVEVGDGSATVERETDAGTQTINVNLPAVLTADLRLCEPRYVKLPNIVKAKKKPLETLAAADMGVDMAPRYEVVAMAEPAEREAGAIVESVDELVSGLQGAGAL